MKKVLLVVLAVVVVLIAYLGITYGPKIKRLMAYSVEEVDANLRVLSGSGGNTVVLRSDDASRVLIVDTKMGKGAKRLKEVVDAIAPDAEVIIVNTHTHNDHTGGNKLFPGARIVSGAYDEEYWVRETKSERMPDVALAAGEEHVLEMGDEIVRIQNVGRGHSWNDVVVYLQNRKLLVTGDLIFIGWHPVLIEEAGGNVDRWIRNLDFLLERFEVATVIPGHGEISNRNGLEIVREYFVSIRDAVGDEDRLAELKMEYKDWLPMPGISGFHRTVEFASKLTD